MFIYMNKVLFCSILFRYRAKRQYVVVHNFLDNWIKVQSTLAISKSKGPSEILRDIRSSTYQMCRTEENTNQTTKFHKCTCNLTPLVRNIF